jgi:hypothetical protein
MANRQDSDLYSCTMIKYRRDVISTLESYSVLKRLITSSLRYRKLNTRAVAYGNGLQTSPPALLLVRLSTRLRSSLSFTSKSFPSLRVRIRAFLYRKVRSPKRRVRKGCRASSMISAETRITSGPISIVL